jgi:hypothetical protein
MPEREASMYFTSVVSVPITAAIVTGSARK